MARYGKAHPSRISQSQVCPLRVLKDFYRRCYHVIRAACPNTVAVVLHDRFELRRWNRFMPRGSSYQNVWMDTHMYLGFSDGRFRRKDLAHYLRFANRVFAKRLSRAAKYHPVLVGEWSNANHIEGLSSKPAEEQRALYQQLSRAQLAAWDNANGGCFWSFANESAVREARQVKMHDGSRCRLRCRCEQISPGGDAQNTRPAAKSAQGCNRPRERRSVVSRPVANGAEICRIKLFALHARVQWIALPHVKRGVEVVLELVDFRLHEPRTVRQRRSAASRRIDILSRWKSPS